MSIPNEAVEAVARTMALASHRFLPRDWDDRTGPEWDEWKEEYRAPARDALKAAAPFIAAQALEEAANAFENLPKNKGATISNGTSDMFELFPVEHIRWRAEDIRGTE